METKEKIGEIQAIRKDFKAIEVENIWYNAFDSSLKNFNKGDKVKIKFIVNKNFNNIQSIESNNPENQIPEKLKVLSDTVKNCIIMTAKDIYIQRKDVTLDQATILVLKAYSLIK